MIPPATLVVSDAHAMMTAEEAENAFKIGTEADAPWTVTLTGSNYVAALSSEAQARQAHEDAAGRLKSAQETEGSSAQAESDAVQTHADAELAVIAAQADEAGAAQAESDAIQAHADAEVALAAALAEEAGAAQTESDAIQVHADAEAALAAAEGDEAAKANAEALRYRHTTMLRRRCLRPSQHTTLGCWIRMLLKPICILNLNKVGSVIYKPFWTTHKWCLMPPRRMLLLPSQRTTQVSRQRPPSS